MKEADLIGRVPPQSLEAERAVLGSMLMDFNTIVKVQGVLNELAFYAPNHQIICKTVFDMYRKKQAVDLTTVSDKLKSLNILDDIGGYMYLLDIVESVPTTANVQDYALIVQDKFIRREVFKIANELIESSFDFNIDAEKFLEDTQQKLYKIGQSKFKSDFVHLSTILNQEFEETAKAKEEGLLCDPTKIKTGISDMDNILNGGYNPSDLIIIAGRPGMGKTGWVLNNAVNIAKNNKTVGIISLEMPGKQLAQRMISSEGEIELPRLITRVLSDSDFEKYTDTVGYLSSLNIFIDDTSSVGVEEVQAKARRLKERENLDVLIIDYLQIMDFKDEMATSELGKITRTLKRTARDLDIPIILLSQLSRDVEKRANKRPQLSDLRSSGSIEQDCDICIFLYRDEYYNPDSEKKKTAEVIFAKHRNGETGSFDVFFEGAFTKFSGLER